MNIIRNQARACAFILAALATGANAASVTVVGPASVTPGASFSIDLEGDFTDVGLFGGGMVVSWDPALFTLDLVTLDPDAELNAFDTGASCPGTAAYCVTNAGDTMVGFFPNTTILGLATGTLAQLDFTSTGASGTGTFGLADELSIFGGMADLAGAPIAMTYNSLDVTAGTTVIPVPAAVWLFGSGLLGLVGVARRRTAA